MTILRHGIQQVRQGRYQAVLMLLLLGLVYWIYQYGFTAGFKFDDPGSIGGVGGVHDFTSGLAYLFDGRAGALGRPLALATFLLQKESWPEDAAAFFLVNTLIHLVNGVLVFWLSYRLATFFPEKLHHPSWFSLTVTAMWLTLPLHVSASLMAVQRMATLSSTFMLLGLIGYVSGRALLKQSPVRAYKRMTIAVVTGTVLALLCKENGALLPLSVLVIEFALMGAGRLPADLKLKRWVWIFLIIPNVLLVAYFIYRWPTLVRSYGIRDFNVVERLLTEARILWDYLRHIVLPSIAGTGPYQDDYVISRSLTDPATTLVAILAWMSAVIAAWVFRRRFPLILFAVLWFLACHLLESSVLPLELYFEHRNYLAAFGPLLVLTALIWQVPDKIRRISLAGLLLMVLLRIFVLAETTQLWGQPMLAARMWVEDHPQSARAAQYLARVYFYAGDENAARVATEEGHARIKTDIGLALQSVYLNCQRDDAPTFISRFDLVRDALRSGMGGTMAPELLTKMLDAQQKGGCQNLTYEQLFDAANLLLSNPYNNAAPGVMAALHIFKYRLYASQGKPNLSIRELFTAFSIKKELAIAVAIARTVAEAGHVDDALRFLDRAMSYAPRNPILRQHWKSEFEKLQLSIRQKKQELSQEKQ